MAYNKNTKTKRKINKLIFSYYTHPFPDPGSTHRDPELTHLDNDVCFFESSGVVGLNLDITPL